MIISIQRILLFLLLLSIKIISITTFAFAASNLESNSPFIPYDRPVADEAVQKGAVEFRGIMDYAGEVKFSLYNANTKESKWVKLNESSGPYTVEKYDPQKQLIEVVISGSPQQLKMSKPSDGVTGPLGRASMPPRPPAPSPPTPPKDKEAIGPPTDEVDEQKRQEMADKVYDAFKKYVAEKKAREARETIEE